MTFDPAIIRELERAETEAMVDSFRAFAEVRDPKHHPRIDRVGSLLCSALPGGPPALFNRVFEAGLERPLQDNGLADIEAHYRRLGLPFRIGVAPGSRPEDLPERLVQRGFSPGMSWMKFSRGPTPPEDRRTDYVIRDLDRDRADDFGRIVVQAFRLPSWLEPFLARLVERPSWSCFGAFDGPDVIAVGALCVRNERAWLGFGATVERARGRGAQKALLSARIAAAIEQGAALLAVETGVRQSGKPSPSYDNILKAGFVEAYARDHFDAS